MKPKVACSQATTNQCFTSLLAVSNPPSPFLLLLKDKFRWADRDFNVAPRVIEDFIISFFLRDNNISCHDRQVRANETKFVLYNAFCKESLKSNRYVARQYYKDEDKTLPRNIHVPSPDKEKRIAQLRDWIS